MGEGLERGWVTVRVEGCCGVGGGDEAYGGRGEAEVGEGARRGEVGQPVASHLRIRVYEQRVHFQRGGAGEGGEEGRRARVSCMWVAGRWKRPRYWGGGAG